MPLARTRLILRNSGQQSYWRLSDGRELRQHQEYFESYEDVVLVKKRNTRSKGTLYQLSKNCTESPASNRKWLAKLQHQSLTNLIVTNMTTTKLSYSWRRGGDGQMFFSSGKSRLEFRSEICSTSYNTSSLSDGPCNKSARDSALHTFSHSPTVGSSEPLAFQPSAYSNHMPLAGLQPSSFGNLVRRVIHYTTRTHHAGNAESGIFLFKSVEGV